mmetsp:Transcript_12693/g.40489  ORF Transcript_12693/g.40489 Transcript_12693/m.40489 type:complete len:213 (+) Transcript_12693:136-774(+)
MPACGLYTTLHTTDDLGMLLYSYNINREHVGRQRGRLHEPWRASLWRRSSGPGGVYHGVMQGGPLLALDGISVRVGKRVHVGAEIVAAKVVRATAAGRVESLQAFALKRVLDVRDALLGLRLCQLHGSHARDGGVVRLLLGWPLLAAGVDEAVQLPQRLAVESVEVHLDLVRPVAERGRALPDDGNHPGQPVAAQLLDGRRQPRLLLVRHVV